MATFTLERIDYEEDATGTVASTAVVEVTTGPMGGTGPIGPTGPAGPNLITDATALGTLTDIADPAFLLVGAAAGNAARKLTPTPWGLSNLLASVPAGRVPFSDAGGLPTSNAGLTFNAGTGAFTAGGFSTGPNSIFTVLGGQYLRLTSGSGNVYVDENLWVLSSGGHSTAITPSGVKLGPARSVTWTAIDPTTVADTGLARDSAGTVRITNGSTGVGNLITGNLTVRQPGGTAGSNEATHVHGGSAYTITNVNTGGLSHLRLALAGGEYAEVTRSSGFTVAPIGTARYLLQDSQMRLASGVNVGWSGFSVPTSGFNDVGFNRLDANTIEVNNGTPTASGGALRDMRLRVLHVTGGTVASFTPTVGNRPRTVLTQGSSAFALMSGPIDSLSVAPLGTYSTRTGIALGGCTSLTYGDNWFSASARRAGGVADSQGGGWSQGSWYFELGRVSDGAAGAFVVGNNHASATGNFQRQWYSHPGNLVFCGFTSTTDRESAAIQNAWADSTDATRTGRLLLSVYSTTTPQEGIRIDANSGGVRLGFYGVPAVARPTLPDAGTVTAADIRTALISLGLCQ